MGNDSEQVTALIKELLVLNRAESKPATESPTGNEVEERKVQRKRIRQELVQVLSHHRKKG